MGLADEYHGYSDGQWGEYSLTTYGQCITATESSDTNMFFDGGWKDVEGPWSAWANLGGVDWNRECSDTRWLRPSADSIMRSGYGFYNSVSEFIIKNELDRVTTGTESTLPGYGNTGSDAGGIFSK